MDITYEEYVDIYNKAYRISAKRFRSSAEADKKFFKLLDEARKRKSTGCVDVCKRSVRDTRIHGERVEIEYRY